MTTLAIACTDAAARALAAEYALDPSDVRPVTYGTALGGRIPHAAVIALPPDGLSREDVDWIEEGVLTRLPPGVELVVRRAPLG